MNIVFFTHPEFIKSKSMPRYADILVKGMVERGHNVEVWKPKAVFYKIPFPAKGKKWLGYIDQFLVFPLKVKRALKTRSVKTLYVLVDQSLGPWMYLINKRKHIIHCHDFLAQRSATGEFSQNKLKQTGKAYQKMIRSGFQRGKNFISISEKTRSDLHAHLLVKPQVSEVICNSINQQFTPGDKAEARKKVEENINDCRENYLKNGYILNVGVNSWYKNKRGVIQIYNSWRIKYKFALPIIVVGDLDQDLKKMVNEKFWKEDFFQIKDVSEELLIDLYRGASVFLFPSYAEGFGWPIAEAMACGCPVITTNEAPMTEVGGSAAIYIPLKPPESDESFYWPQKGADAIQHILSQNERELSTIIDQGFKNVKRFNSEEFLNKVELLYKKVIAKSNILNDGVTLQ